MKHKGFLEKTRTAEEVNQYNARERERLSGGMFGSKLLPKPGGEIPALSPARPGAAYALRSQGGNRKGMIDR